MEVGGKKLEVGSDGLEGGAFVGGLDVWTSGKADSGAKKKAESIGQFFDIINTYEENLHCKCTRNRKMGG